MTDDLTAIHEAGMRRLPELAATNAELAERLHSLLSPGVVQALATPSGSGAAGPAFGTDADLAARATSLIRELDSQLPALRVVRSTETVK